MKSSVTANVTSYSELRPRTTVKGKFSVIFLVLLLVGATVGLAAGVFPGVEPPPAEVAPPDGLCWPVWPELPWRRLIRPGNATAPRSALTRIMAARAAPTTKPFLFEEPRTGQGGVKSGGRICHCGWAPYGCAGCGVSEGWP